MNLKKLLRRFYYEGVQRYTEESLTDLLPSDSAHFEQCFNECDVIQQDERIIDGYTQILIDPTTLPNDGQHVKFMTENEEWHEGYFVSGDDIFHVTDSQFYFKWHVHQWKAI